MALSAFSPSIFVGRRAPRTRTRTRSNYSASRAQIDALGSCRLGLPVTIMPDNWAFLEIDQI